MRMPPARGEPPPEPDSAHGFILSAAPRARNACYGHRHIGARHSQGPVYHLPRHHLTYGSLGFKHRPIHPQQLPLGFIGVSDQPVIKPGGTSRYGGNGSAISAPGTESAGPPAPPKPMKDAARPVARSNTGRAWEKAGITVPP